MSSEKAHYMKSEQLRATTQACARPREEPLLFPQYIVANMKRNRWDCKQKFLFDINELRQKPQAGSLRPARAVPEAINPTGHNGRAGAAAQFCVKSARIPHARTDKLAKNSAIRHKRFRKLFRLFSPDCLRRKGLSP